MSKRITISKLLRNRPDWLDTSIASILLGLSVAGTPVAFGQCQPATPQPCAADGMCYPKRESWGSYTTHWRPFPGDSIGLIPTPADGGTVEIQEKLPTFIVPTPDKEDQRGPTRPTRQAAPANAPAPAEGEINELPAVGLPAGQAPPADAEQQPEPAAEEAPGPLDDLDLPGFGPPQGLLQPLPQTEDGLPALPSALSQALTMGSEVGIQSNFPTHEVATAVPTVRANSSRVQPNVAVAPSRSVTQAAANIELVNPAAKNVQKTMDHDLQQAIYYEASDLDSLK